MGAFCSTVQKLQIVLCWKPKLLIDFKIESVLIVSFITQAESQEKENKILYIERETTTRNRATRKRSTRRFKYTGNLFK